MPILTHPFANYYMVHIENQLIPSFSKSHDITSCRYVDDIFIIVENHSILEQICIAFENSTVLKFTYEVEKNKRLSFLDCIIERREGTLTTSVYVKYTHSGNCINYRSLCPDRYKESVINTLLYRAYHVSSNWSLFDSEISKIKQLLVNNNFPMQVIDSCIHRFVDRKILKQTRHKKSTEVRGNKEFSNTDNMNRIDEVADSETEQLHGNIATTRDDNLGNKSTSSLDRNTGIVVDQNSNVVGEYILECNLNSIPKNSEYIASSTTERNDVDPSISTPNNDNICIFSNASGTSNSILTTRVANTDSSGLFNRSLVHNDSRNPNNGESPSYDSNTDSMRNGHSCKTAESNVTVHEEPPNKYLKQPIKIYYQNQMTTNYKAQEKQIHQTIKKNITCLKAESYVKVIIYYRNRKLKNLFIRNSPKVKEEFDAVYRYSCNREPCNGTQSYVGYTTTLLSTRMGFHAQEGFIRKHHMDTHNVKINETRKLG